MVFRLTIAVPIDRAVLHQDVDLQKLVFKLSQSSSSATEVHAKVVKIAKQAITSDLITVSVTGQEGMGTRTGGAKQTGQQKNNRKYTTTHIGYAISME
jgi:hypothetical protein